MTSRLRQHLDFGVLYLLFLVARPLPRRLLLATGRGLGTLVWRVFRFRREVVLANLTGAFGSELDADEIRRLAHAFYRNLGMTLMEFLRSPHMKQEDVRDLVSIEGTENLQAVVDRGRGGLLVSGHFGNWELLGARMVAEGHQVSFIVKTQSNPEVDRIQNDIRRRAGVGIIRSGASIKEMILALRRQEFIGLLGDQNAGADGIFTDFLGRSASVFRGTAYLAWKLKCPILTGFIFRQPDGRHVARIDPPIDPDPDWDEETAVRHLTEMHVQRLAAAVRKSPEQYFWVHRRWKTRPPEEAS